MAAEGDSAPTRNFLAELVEHKPALAALGIVVLTLLAHAVLLVTPGFYGNDEWQKFDHIRLHGGLDYLQAYGAIRPGTEFGYPVRPIGFLQQGVAALWMQSAPVASHLVSIANHALVAIVFVWVLRRARVPGDTAGLAGVLFVLSPLATMATGWTAASFDQLYVLFLLFVAAIVVRLPEEGLSPLRGVALLVATTASLLAKETAIVAPGIVLLLGFLDRCRHPGGFKWRSHVIAFTVVLLPVVAYLLFRAPAITASLTGHVTAEYTPSAGNVPDNAWRFFTYPFRVRLVEMSATVYRSPWQPLAAGAIHVLLVGALGRLFGWRYALAYVAAYFLFLVPALAIPNPGTQCLYGAGLAMSLALAAIITRLMVDRKKFALLVAAMAAVGLSVHSIEIQRHLYQYGKCQSQFLGSLDHLLAQQSGAETARIVVVPDAGAPARVAVRAVTAREAYTANGQPTVTFETPDQQSAMPTAPGAIRARMTATCALQRE